MTEFEQRAFSGEYESSKEERVRRFLMERLLYARAAAEEVWNEHTAQEGDFNLENPSAGQCAPTTGYFLNLLDDMAKSAALHHEFGRRDIHEGDILQGSVMSFQFGDLFSYDGTLMTDDHCWGKITYPDDNISLDLDLTPDQLLCEGFVVPPITLQNTGEYDGQPFIHVARLSTPIDDFNAYNPADHGARQFQFSFGLFMRDEYDVSRRVAEERFHGRAKELEMLSFPGTNIVR